MDEAAEADAENEAALAQPAQPEEERVGTIEDSVTETVAQTR